MIFYKEKTINKLNDDQKTLLYILFMVIFFIGFLSGGFLAQINYKMKEEAKQKKINNLICYCAGDADCLEKCGE